MRNHPRSLRSLVGNGPSSSNIVLITYLVLVTSGSSDGLGELIVVLERSYVGIGEVEVVGLSSVGVGEES